MTTPPTPWNSPTRGGPADPSAALARIGPPMLAMLVLQLLFGMGLNLFVTLPSGSAGSILLSSPLLILHLLLAIGLIGISARAVSISARLRESRTRLLGASVLALVSAIVATVAGLSFTFGPGGAATSYVMTVGFAGMLLGAGVLMGARRPRPAPEATLPPAAPSSGGTEG